MDSYRIPGEQPMENDEKETEQPKTEPRKT